MKLLCWIFGCWPVELGSSGVIYCRVCKRIKKIGTEHFLEEQDR